MGRAACTEMACPGGGARRSLGSECTPGTTWKKDCNTCTCTGGRAACTLMACLDLGGGGGGGRDNPALRPVPVDNQCAPGTSWNDGCNNCRCTSTGVSICTQRACLHHHKRDVAAGRNGGGCTPGETWKNDCNNCRCTPDGIPACTKKRCIKPAELEAAAAAGQDRRRRELTEPSEGVPHKGCTPGETWKNDCNNCRCTPSGIPACTKMRCIKPPQPEGN
ncbi:hypothetical protein ONE63_003915 [Megalurothrips usitatus]|uniref:Pacifastin domain-containing protein n=1 Tax=Megalurothrips usitatus TaxID=439358 RepID=A0AAV7X4H8_9NEOP|nr:hypothetical protein ONE63_003915 [Megalurothrips usitatus]